MQPTDINGKNVAVGARVRLLRLSGEWFRELPADEKADVESMIGEIFTIDEIDDHGKPWISKSWMDESRNACKGHSISLDSDEMEIVSEGLP